MDKRRKKKQIRNKKLTERYSWLTPRKLIQELQYYKELEREGLLQILPCKIGTTVYKVVNFRDCLAPEDTDKFLPCHISESEVPPLVCKIYDCQYWKNYYHIVRTRFTVDMINNIGKNIFLTEKDAEECIDKKDGVLYAL